MGKKRGHQGENGENESRKRAKTENGDGDTTGTIGVVTTKQAPPPNSTSTDPTTSTTVFVTHLPPTLSSPQLSSLFSTFAPIRSGFVVSSTPAASAASGSNAVNVANNGTEESGSTGGISRGFGYVKFVLHEDASRCVEEWGKKGIPNDWDLGDEADVLKGQGLGKIRVQWAKKRLPQEERVAKKMERREMEMMGKKDDPSSGKKRKREMGGGDGGGGRGGSGGVGKKWVEKDYRAKRTIILQGLPPPSSGNNNTDAMDVDEEEPDEVAGEGNETRSKGDNNKSSSFTGHDNISKAIYKRFRKVGEVEEIRWPVWNDDEVQAHIIFTLPRHAHNTLPKSHNHIFQRHLLTSCLKSQYDALSRTGKGGKLGGRLIVRNLSFDIGKNDLRALFADFGEIHSIDLPLKQQEEEEDREEEDQDQDQEKDGEKDSHKKRQTNRGFAFIWYMSHSSAESALKALNGQRIYSGISEEKVLQAEMAKGKKGREKTKEIKGGGGGGGGGGSEGKGRMMAVDWALGKKDWEGRAKDDEEEESSKVVGNDEDEDGRVSSEEEEGEEDSDMFPVAMDEDEDEDEEDSDLSPEEFNEDEGEEDDEEEEDQDGSHHQKEKGTPLFVRNLSFEARDEEVYDLFKTFGPLRYARVVFDPKTKRSRGTAFVSFWNKQDADEVIELSQQLEGEMQSSSSLEQPQRGAKGPKKPSMLMPDPSSSSASKLSLRGRVVGVAPAVSRQEAEELREERDKKAGGNKDKRNLYLMKEGVLHSSHPLARGLHPADIQARQSSFDVRKSLLRSNPSLYISKVRISVRQIPLYVTESMLRRLALHATKQFDKEVKSHQREPLTKDELKASLENVADKPQTNKKGIPLSKVRQSKVLRQSDRVDPLTGLGRSKGYGFLELGTHAEALKVSRWANGSKEAIQLLHGWWKDDLQTRIKKIEEAEEKDDDGEEEDGLRLERLKKRLEELEQQETKKDKGGTEVGRHLKTLIMEFSIENAVTAHRRTQKREKAVKTKKDSSKPLPKDEAEPKETKEQEENPDPPKKLGQQFGGIIGRKRKARANKR